MVSNQIMIVYIVVKKTPLTILLSTVFFVKKISQEVISWFNVTNSTHLNPSIEEKLFGVTSEPYRKTIAKKF